MSAADDKPDLTFVHLSDIHFRLEEAGDLHDQDEELRNELELDLRTASALVPRIDGIVVSGDIAFRGKEAEYKIAASWLESIRDQVGCPADGVVVSPGNHDVDRDLIPSGGDVEALHNALHAAPNVDELDRQLARAFRDAAQGAHLFRPLTAYNEFAKAYGCAVNPASPYWTKDFPLSDGSSLKLRGLTSALLCSSRDDTHPNQLVYGGAQRRFLRAPNVRHALVAHHPPSWTREGDSGEQVFTVRTLFQLYGHRHVQWFTPIGNSVRLISGAVHPDRREPQWEPRYSILTLKLLDATHLRIRAFPRKWSEEVRIFAPDFRPPTGELFREHTVTIEPAERPRMVAVPATPALARTASTTTTAAAGATVAEADAVSLLEQVGEDLRHHVIDTLAIDVPDHDRANCQAIARHAAQSNKLAELIRTIADHIGETTAARPRPHLEPTS